jgi:hypothetical protein
MASRTIRSTYAFDQDTVKRIKKLAQTWGVSNSEAIRRAVRESEANARNPFAGMTQLEILNYMQAHPLLTKEEADRRVKEMEEARKEFFDRDDR